MTEILSPRSNIPEANMPGSILKDIERPYTQDITLVRGGDAAIINNDFIVRLKHARSNNPFIIIFRDMSIPISWDGSDSLHLYPNADELKGKIAPLGVGFRNFRRQAYIGEKYELTYLPELNPYPKQSIDLIIKSTQPIEMPTHTISQQNLEGLLKRLSGQSAHKISAA